jgi:hypothetical protein
VEALASIMHPDLGPPDPTLACRVTLRHPRPASPPGRVRLVWWRSRTCPVRVEEQQWIERELHWLRAQLGTAALHSEVIVPTPEFFPEQYAATPEDAAEVLRRVCRQMAVDESTVDLELIEPDEQGLPRRGSITSGCEDAKARYASDTTASVVAVPGELPRRPVALVAGLAHQVGHVRLLREGRVSATRRDHEPLADLLLVFFGLGTFAANAALEFHKRASGDPLAPAKNLRGALFGGGSSAYRQGDLTEPMYGYALAYYTWLRGLPNVEANRP